MHAVPGQPGDRPGARSSIVDVAARAGVSVATVSRALRDLPNVSPVTRERVLLAAAELDYTVSPLASGLVTGRVRSVGVVLPYANRWFFAEVLRGIEEVLRGQGYDLVLHVLADRQRRQEFFEQLPVRRRVDAVLLVALPLEAREIGALRGLDVPLASVGEPLTGLHSDRIDDVARRSGRRAAPDQPRTPPDRLHRRRPARPGQVHRSGVAHPRATARR